MDEAIATMTRLDNARVCMYIHTGQVIHTEISVNVGRETICKVEYEWLPLCVANVGNLVTQLLV